MGIAYTVYLFGTVHWLKRAKFLFIVVLLQENSQIIYMFELA